MKLVAVSTFKQFVAVEGRVTAHAIEHRAAGLVPDHQAQAGGPAGHLGQGLPGQPEAVGIAQCVETKPLQGAIEAQGPGIAARLLQHMQGQASGAVIHPQSGGRQVVQQLLQHHPRQAGKLVFQCLGLLRHCILCVIQACKQFAPGGRGLLAQLTGKGLQLLLQAFDGLPQQRFNLGRGQTFQGHLQQITIADLAFHDLQPWVCGRQVRAVLAQRCTLNVDDAQDTVWRPAGQSGYQVQLHLGIVCPTVAPLLHLHNKAFNHFTEADAREAVTQQCRQGQMLQVQLAQHALFGIAHSQRLPGTGIAHPAGLRPQAAQQLTARPVHGVFQLMHPGAAAVVLDARSVGLGVMGMLNMPLEGLRVDLDPVHFVFKPDKLPLTHAVQPLGIR